MVKAMKLSAKPGKRQMYHSTTNYPLSRREGCGKTWMRKDCSCALSPGSYKTILVLLLQLNSLNRAIAKKPDVSAVPGGAQEPDATWWLSTSTFPWALPKF